MPKTKQKANTTHTA